MLASAIGAMAQARPRRRTCAESGCGVAALGTGAALVEVALAGAAGLAAGTGAT
jgi:hypothetical protein